MDAPDISQYAYVSQDALIGPKFSDIVLNEPTNLGTPGNQIVTCEATATATFKNKGVEINVPVTLPFEYSDAGETWVPGDLVVGEAAAVPLASANANDILANLNGTQYRLTTIAVATSGLDDNGKSLIGRKADVKGPLEESFATSWSPAGVKALEIHVE